MRKPRSCSIPGCSNPHMARGWCTKHWYRWRRHGDPLEGRTFEGEPLTFLYEVVLAYDGDECLTWPFTKTSKGYGQVLIDDSLQVVSRVVCEIVNGPPPSPVHQAAHSCGNGHEACCTKRHLSWKTPTANQLERADHGTSIRGEGHHLNKLTRQDVLAIRALEGQAPIADVGARFGVDKSTVHKIQKRKLWAWL